MNFLLRIKTQNKGIKKVISGGGGGGVGGWRK